MGVSCQLLKALPPLLLVASAHCPVLGVTDCCVNRDRGEVTYRVPDGSDATLRHWGRTGDILMIRFAGEIAAPAAAVWDIIRDGSRRSELDELFDQSYVSICVCLAHTRWFRVEWYPWFVRHALWQQAKVGGSLPADLGLAV